MKSDTNKVYILINISDAYQRYFPDSSLTYAKQALDLAEKLNFERGIFWSAITVSNSFMVLGNYAEQLRYTFIALSLSKKLNTPRTTAYANGMLSAHYYNLGDYQTSLNYWSEVKKINEEWFPDELPGVWLNLSRIYEGLNQSDSAIYYARKAFHKAKANLRLNNKGEEELMQVRYALTILGNAFVGKAMYDSALLSFRTSLPPPSTSPEEINAIDGYNGIAWVYKATGRLDSAVWFSKQVLNSKIAKSYPVSMLKAASVLSTIYRLKNKPDSALKYLTMEIALRDSLFNREKMIAIQNLIYNEQQRQQDVEASTLKLRNRFILSFTIVSFISLSVIGAMIFKNKRQKQLQYIRNRIADDLHDDIGSTMSSINIMSELAKDKSPEARSLLVSISESIHVIQDTMSDIVWAIQSGNDRFENVVQRMNHFAAEILEAKNIELDFTHDLSHASKKITMEQRKNVYLFFKEAINNAAKYSGAKQMSVHISQTGRHVHMSIHDDGKGFDINKISNGNGMNTMKKRASELNGEFKIASRVNEGTDIQLKFKIT